MSKIKRHNKATELKRKTMLITKEIAQEWLAKNTNNRLIRRQAIDKYANDIEKGHWQLNGSSIKFSSEGVLLDGQHRLLAIVKTGKSVMTDVVFGIDPEAFKTIDTGMPRRVADIIGMAGETNAATLASACRLQWLADNKKLNTSEFNTKVSTEETFETIGRHPGLRDAVQDCPRLRFIAPSVAVYLYYQFSKRSQERCRDFFEKLQRGENLQSGDPVLALRNKLTNVTPGSRLKPLWVLTYMIKGWNAFLKGQSKKVFRWRSDKNQVGGVSEEVPEIRG